MDAIDIRQVGPGAIIEYRPFGGDEIRRIWVDLHLNDIKNGRPGFDGTEVNTGRSVWGYDDQITRIIRPATPA
jgi:hypothetical protein